MSFPIANNLIHAILLLFVFFLSFFPSVLLSFCPSSFSSPLSLFRSSFNTHHFSLLTTYKHLLLIAATLSLWSGVQLNAGFPDNDINKGTYYPGIASYRIVSYLGPRLRPAYYLGTECRHNLENWSESSKRNFYSVHSLHFLLAKL